MPEQKCLPSADRTTARTEPDADISSTMAGRSFQNEAIIEFAFSGRFILMWPTLSVISMSKHSCPMR
jgi:hypothetical protein